MPDHLPDLAPDIADNGTLAGGMFLACYFALCIEAVSRDEEMPSPAEAWDIAGESDIAGLLNNTRAVMGTSSKKSMARFFAAFADIIAEYGAEMEMMVHQMARPGEPEKVALIIPRSEAEKLAAVLAGEA